MNVTDAADATVHDYPGGSESLAPRMGMSAAVLRNKVNPGNDRNHLTLAEADRLMRVTGDHRMLQALADQHGYVLQRADEVEQGGSLIEGVLAFGAAGGELHAVIHDAMADGLITEREMQAIERSAAAEHAAVIALIHRLRSVTGRHNAKAAA
jgi:hypothetical protein